jgi:hypothetical protein
VTFRTPVEAAKYLVGRYPFVPGDKMDEFELVALADLMAASQMQEQSLTADQVNDLIERWLPK